MNSSSKIGTAPSRTSAKPQKKSTKKSPESKVQSKIKEALEASGWCVVKHIQTTKNGWPDLEAIKKTQIGSVTYARCVWIECKREGVKEPDPLQQYRHREIRAQGGEVIENAQSVDDIKHLLINKQ